MPDGKWIPELSAATPAVDAARRVLGVRLDAVTHYLPLAAHHHRDDEEYVHQLRVATRRAGAAVRIFAEYLPPKQARAARKRLRCIRRAAGAARDWDVFLAALGTWGAGRPSEEAAGLDFLHGFAFQQRADLQQELMEVSENAIETTEVVAAVEEPKDGDLPGPLGQLAERRIGGLLSKFDAELALADDSLEHLHQVRIRGKRLRYAMEIFAGCFAPAFRHELYPAVEELQDILGVANDSHVAAQRLTELACELQRARPAEWRRYGPGIERLADAQQQKLPQAREQFISWREKWRSLRASVPHWTPQMEVA